MTYEYIIGIAFDKTEMLINVKARNAFTQGINSCIASSANTVTLG